MRQKRLKLCLIFFLGLGLIGLQAQEIHQVINTSGGEAIGTEGTASYSVGQIVYTTNTGGANSSVSQGVQQPYEISELTGLHEFKEISLILSAFPNPANDFLQLKVENYNKENLTYQIYDINGKLIDTKIIKNNITNIVMSTFVSANYFLKVINNNVEVRIFKIIKN